MNILITGAAGFIGSQLSHKLFLDGHKIFLLDNFSYGKEDNLIFPDKDFRPDVLKEDIRNKKYIEKLIEEKDIEVIFHIAGIAPLPDCQSRPEESIDVNVIGTVTLLEAARKKGVKKIIFASTTALYENENEFPSDEGDFPLPTLIYPNTKYAAERFCQSYCDTYGLSITALRFANVYGPHIDCLRKQPPFVGYMIRELYYDRVPIFYSNGNQSRDYIYIDDLIDLALLVMKNTTPGFEAVNVSSNQSYSVIDMFAITSKIMSKNITPQFIDPEQYWSKYPELYSGALPIKQKILYDEVNKKTLCDNGFAKKHYAWKPKIDITEGLKRSVAYVEETLQKMDLKK